MLASHLERLTLDEWLAYQESLSTKSIDLGLDRVVQVWENMGNLSFDCPVIVVGGTNGKGSTIRFLQLAYQQAGYTTAVYTSPHIERYNERVAINDHAVDDPTLIDAFEVIEQARGNIALTYFEYGTLAALWCFHQSSPDIVLLEVGLGGRLDAVNILSHDVAIVTNVSLDHMDWLGDTVEKIAYEKAGIAREGRPLIYAESNTPVSLTQYASDIDAILVAEGEGYQIQINADSWDFTTPVAELMALPVPKLSGQHQISNSAAAIYAIQYLNDRLPVDRQDIERALSAFTLPGRFQSVSTRPEVIVDVAHNEAAVDALSENLQRLNTQSISAVFGLQSNREIASITKALIDIVDHWYVSSLRDIDSHVAADISKEIKKLNDVANITECTNVAEALTQACENTPADSTVCVFGSFYTVSEVIEAMRV